LPSSDTPKVPPPGPVALLAPLLAYAGAEALWGTRPAVAVSIALALVEVVWARWRYGAVPRSLWASAALVTVLGVPSLWSDDPSLVRWTPAIGDVLFAGALVVATLRGRSPTEDVLAEQLPAEEVTPALRAWARRFGWRLVGVSLIHAACVAAVVDADTVTWTWVSGPGQFALLGALVGVEWLGSSAPRFGD
jgi:intracellular septation protein A